MDSVSRRVAIGGSWGYFVIQPSAREHGYVSRALCKSVAGWDGEFLMLPCHSPAPPKLWHGTRCFKFSLHSLA